MSPEEREIRALSPWTAPAMAQLVLAGVTFKLERDSNTHAWRARWQVEGEYERRNMVEPTLGRLVHRVALAMEYEQPARVFSVVSTESN